MRILAVDDEQIVLDLLKSVLDNAGYHDAVFAHSSEHALDILESEPTLFDCFMLDIVMPGIDGIELCRRIRSMSDYTTAPIIMISRMADKLHFDRAFTAGANDYVTKPFDGVELGTRVRLADNIVRQQKEIRFADAQVAGLSSTLAQKQAVKLSSTFTLEDVEGSIENLALENYLLQLSNGLYAMQFFAVKIANIVDIHKKATGDEFRLIINSVADVVSGVLSGPKFFVAHAGNGLLSCVVHGSSDRSISEITKAIINEMQDLDFTLSTGDTVSPEIVVGTSGAFKIIPRSKSVTLMREAVMNAEKMAAELPLYRAINSLDEGHAQGLVARVMSVF